MALTLGLLGDATAGNAGPAVVSGLLLVLDLVGAAVLHGRRTASA